MSSGTQVDLDWAGVVNAPASVPDATGFSTGSHLSDEEILGIAPEHSTATSRRDVIPSEARNPSSVVASGDAGVQRDSSGQNRPRFTENVHRERNDPPSPENGCGGQAGTPSLEDSYGVQARAQGQGQVEVMPAWMQAAAGDPRHGVEAQQLWQEHQEFRAAFASPAEARTLKELFPGGAPEAQSLKVAAQSVDRIDAAIFSGDARAQAEVVAEIARANPAAFRSLFAEAAKVLGVGQAFLPVQGDATAGAQRDSSGQNRPRFTENVHRERNDPPSPESGFGGHGPHPSQEPGTSQSPVTGHPSQALGASQSPVTSHESPTFDPVAYAAFERSTNDAVARDVRSSIQDTLARVLPEGIADGASRRIGEDIFNEIHRALAADRGLSEQVGVALREPLLAGQGWRFGAAEQQRVASLLAGRAKQLVPSVARRVIGEWTSSVLGTARSKAARQAAAASRVDIAAAGGSLDSMPLRAMSPREVNYASMSDDEILGM